jgi:hypothetical protein
MASVLYNFEFVSTKPLSAKVGQRRANDWVTPEFIFVHSMFETWDYSW